MSAQRSKTALFYGPHKIRIESLPMPNLKMGEVLVRIGAALTCGTDLKTYRRGHPVIIKSLPSPFGHEMAGTVVETASDVHSVRPGDRVVVANSAPCQFCFYCLKGKPNLCENLTFLNGAFAQHIVVPAPIVAHNLHKIPSTLEFAEAALSEPLACVLHASEHMRIQEGETVAVIGTGPMAFLFIEVLRLLRAKSVIIGRNPERLELARHYGATHVVNNREHDAVEAVRAFTNSHGADVAIEAVGQPETWKDAINLVRKGGRVCLYGGCAKGTELNLDTYRIHYEEITVSGIFHHTPALFRKAVTLLSEKQIRTDAFLSHRRRLEDLEGIFEGRESDQPLKFVIDPTT